MQSPGPPAVTVQVADVAVVVGGPAVLLLGRSEQFVLLVAGLGLMGVGLGFAQSGLQSASMEAAPVAQAGAAAINGFSKYIETTDPKDYAANIQRLIDEGCQSIVTVGFNQGQATVDATKANPDIAFSQVDATWDETANSPIPANFTGIDFQIDQAGMLAGYLAAGFSKTGKIALFNNCSGKSRLCKNHNAGRRLH